MSTEIINTMTMDKDIHAAIKIVANKNEELAVSLIQEISSGYDKDAAQKFLDLMILNRQPIKDAIVNGNNKSYNGSTRFWNNVLCTGIHRTNKFGHKMLEVIDPYSDYQTRWLKLESFSGTITYVNNEVSTWDKGKKTVCKNITDSHSKQYIAHKAMIVKEFFPMNHKEWEKFLSNTTSQTIKELIGMCEKEKSNRIS